MRRPVDPLRSWLALLACLFHALLLASHATAGATQRADPAADVASPPARPSVPSGATLPPGCEDGSIFVRTGLDPAIYACGEARTWRALTGAVAPGPHQWQVRASDFGARCDNRADDTAALQTAVDALRLAGGGDLLLPVGTCVLRDTLTIGRSDAPYAKVNLIGQSEDSSHLSFRGPMDRPAVFANHVSYAHWRNFSVSGPGPADFQTHGTAVGILVGADGGAGTQSTGLTLEHVSVSGFRYGLLLGTGSRSVTSASEFTCRHCNFNYNDVGVTWSDYNTLNLAFYEIGMGFNTRGMEVGGDGRFARQASDGPTVLGGATSYNEECDFCLGNMFGTVVIQGVRAELRHRFIKGAAFGPMIITKNVVTPTGAADQIVIELDPGAPVRITENALNGKVALGTDRVGSVRAAVTMSGNSVLEGTPGWPVLLPTRIDAGLTLRLWGNIEPDPGNRVFADREGIYSGAPQARWFPTSEVDRSETGYPLGAVALPRVRSLGLGSTTPGFNLRDQVSFPNAGRAEFRFVRTVPVSTNASTTLSFAPGAIRAIDVGKAIVLPNATDQCAGNVQPRPYDAVDGVIAAILDATHAVLAPRPWAYWMSRCAQVVSRTLTDVPATIGRAEPDAQWFAVGLVCDQDARYWVTDITASGATFHSSDPGSTATCTFMVVR